MKSKKYEGLVDEPSNMPSILKSLKDEDHTSPDVKKDTEKTLEIGNRIIEIHNK